MTKNHPLINSEEKLVEAGNAVKQELTLQGTISEDTKKAFLNATSTYSQEQGKAQQHSNPKKEMVDRWEELEDIAAGIVTSLKNKNFEVLDMQGFTEYADSVMALTREHYQNARFKEDNTSFPTRIAKSMHEMRTQIAKIRTQLEKNKPAKPRTKNAFKKAAEQYIHAYNAILASDVGHTKALETYWKNIARYAAETQWALIQNTSTVREIQAFQEALYEAETYTRKVYTEWGFKLAA